MDIRKKIDKFYEKYPIGIWALIGNGGFMLLGILICQINATDYNGYPYSSLNHTISELGFIGVTWGWWLFSIIMIVGGIFTCIFLFGLGLLIKGKYSGPISKIGIITGCLSALSMIGVGLTPANKFTEIHLGFASSLFIFAAITPLIFSLAILLQNNEEKSYFIPKWTVLLGIIVGIIGIIFVNLSVETYSQNSETYIDIVSAINFTNERDKFIPLYFSEWTVLYACTIWLVIFGFKTRKVGTE